MRYPFFILLTLNICALMAQTNRGLSLPADTKSAPEGKTYALIVGISKYKNPAIPQLQYADRDAYAFSEYLRGEGIDSNNIHILLNERAKASEFWADLLYFTELARQGDRVYIYFSGHGDVESHTIVPDAFLLPYDAPTVAYASGAIGILYLKSYIATMSAHGVKVIFIADACRSGNLSGGREGMEATANMLKGKWEDEVKILSCQPGELSLESKQWGGGRGLFSYELINGLAGQADKNKDGKISLRELNLYLMDKVPEGASPAPQNPIVDGNPETPISKVNEKMLARINSAGSANALAMVDVRGYAEELLKNKDKAIQANYQAFKACMDSGNYAAYADEQLATYTYGQPAESMKLKPSALYYLRQIPANDTTRYLLAYMRRNLSAALLDEISDTSSDAMKKVQQIARGQNTKLIMQQMKNYIKGIELKSIALEQLLGADKLKKLGVYSKLVLTEVQILSFVDTQTNSAKYALTRLDSAIAYDPNNPYLYFTKGTTLLIADSTNVKGAIVELKRATEISPKFTMAYPMLAFCFKDLKQMDSVVYYSRKAMQYESDNPFRVRCLYIVMLGEFGWKDSLKVYIDSIDRYIPGNVPQPMLNNYFVMISKTALQSQLADGAIHIANKIIGDENSMWVISKYILLASGYSLKEDKLKALEYFKTALERGYNFYDRIQANKSLDGIRKEPEFKALMKKYFPKEYKD